MTWTHGVVVAYIVVAALIGRLMIREGLFERCYTRREKLKSLSSLLLIAGAWPLVYAVAFIVIVVGFAMVCLSKWQLRRLERKVIKDDEKLRRFWKSIDDFQEKKPGEQSSSRAWGSGAGDA